MTTQDLHDARRHAAADSADLVAALLWRMHAAAFDPRRPAGCEQCGEGEFSPSVEAFELTDKLLCDECAEAALEDSDQ